MDETILQNLLTQVTNVSRDMAEIKSDVRSVRERLERFDADLTRIDARLTEVEKQRGPIIANITSTVSLLLAISSAVLAFLLTGS